MVLTVAVVVVAVLPAAAGGDPSVPRFVLVGVEDLPPPDPPMAPTGLSLGAIFTTNTPGWSAVLGRPSARGALVLAVLPGSAAESANLSPGDVVVAVDDREIRDADRASVVLRSPGPVDRVFSIVAPDGRPRVVRVRMRESAVSVAGYLSHRLAAEPDTVSRYLYAQTFAEPTEALRLAELIVRTAPEFAEGHALLARKRLDSVLGASDRTTPSGSPPPETIVEVSALLRRAVDLDPLSADIAAADARAHRDLGQFDAAESSALRALDLDAGSAVAHHMLGAARLALGRPDAALTDLRLAVDLDPYRVDPYQDLARCYSALGMTAPARATERALSVLKSGGAKEGPRRSSTVGILAGIVALAAGIGGPVALSRRRVGSSVDRGEHRPLRGDRALELNEMLLVVGLWGMIGPVAARGFGLGGAAGLDDATVGHFVPGLVILGSGIVGAISRISSAGRGSARYITTLVAALAGSWMLLTHLSVFTDVVGDPGSWWRLFFHASAALAALTLSAFLWRQLTLEKGVLTQG